MSHGHGAQFTNRAGVTVELSDEAVLISRNGESPPPRALAYGSIRSVIFKSAGITNGYIQFCTDARKKVDSLNKAIGDSNTVVFSKDTGQDFERLRDLVNEKLKASSQNAPIAPVKLPEVKTSDRAKSAPAARGANYRDPNKADHSSLLWTIILGVLFLAFALSKCGTGTPSNTMNVDENLTTDMNAADADINATAPAVTQTISRYLAMDSNVRAGPTSTSRALGRLARGALVEGTLVPGSSSLGPWLKLNSGPHAGGYVLAMGNLRKTAPPAIDTTAAGFRVAADRAPIYAEPDAASEVLDYTTAGQRVHVHGRTGDGYLEVGVKSDRIGYVREEAVYVEDEPSSEVVDQNGMPTTSTTTTAGQSAPPTLRNPQFIGADDYPVQAVARGEQGNVSVMVGVDINGRVTACVVTRSSGSAFLDEASCRLIRSRAQFDPAVGNDGRPTSGVFTKTFTWKLTD